MKPIFKAMIVSSSIFMSLYSFADQCTAINGFYSGSYNDPTGLFPSGNFPMNAYLQYQKGMIYGYTLSAQDANGPAYGQAPYALIWGNCQNNHISNLYIIKNTSNPCGDPEPHPISLSYSGNLNLRLNYENAMINALLQANLSPSTSVPAVNQDLLQAAINLAKQGIQTCH